MSKSIFEDVTISWAGKEYTVKANEVMGLIRRIEDHISWNDLISKQAKISRLSDAWAEVLSYVGVGITPEEVYELLFDGATMDQIWNSVNTLMIIMVPPKHLQKKTEASKPARVKRAKKKQAR